MVSSYIKSTLIIVAAAFFVLACGGDNDTQGTPIPGTGGSSNEPYVLLVSFDGFRHDYVDKFDATNFKAFIEDGSAAESMRPVFPTKTFPNHYSTATGMYPVNSGIIDNIFYDPDSETTYSIGNNIRILDPYYYNGQPIWNIIQEHGIKTASYFWLGSEVRINGRRPDYYEVFDSSVPNEDRIEGVIDWFKLPKKDRPNFATLYFSFVDTQGHATGPENGAIVQSVLEADRLLGVLMDELETLDFEVNVILTSDHGMYLMENKPETFIYMDDVFEGLEDDDFRIVSNRSHLNLFVDNPDVADDLYRIVKPRERDFTIYKKEDIPAEWHYQNSRRVGDFFLQAEPGHFFTTRSAQATRPEQRPVWGIHGFDPAEPDMHGIFYAKGPHIKEGLQLATFENIHIYPLICEIFGIVPPNDIDGRLEVLAPILKD